MTEQLGLDLTADPPRAPRAAALRHFHARDERPTEALAGERRAQRQERIILEYLRTKLGGARLTPSELHDELVLFTDPATRAWPLTSIRRALTNLTKAGFLQKHREDRRMGPRGARECTWSL